MIHTARQQFDRILDSLHAQSAAQATAYQVEQNLFAQLLALGRLLLGVDPLLWTPRGFHAATRD